jgi:segregation and condensation protein A
LKNQKKEINEVDPLGVLLNLLEKKNLEISNFSLAEVADQYIEYLNDFENQEEIIENISEFLWVASKLVLMKSKIILNDFKFKEDELQEEDENELRDRLLEYKKIREISLKINKTLNSKKELISKIPRNFNNKDFSINFNQNDLKEIFRKIITDYKLDHQEIYQKKKVKDIIKIKERIKQIKNTLKKIKQINFSQVISNNKNQLEIVVSFLSVLELFKQGAINLKQDTIFEDIELSELKK